MFFTNIFDQWFNVEKIIKNYPRFIDDDQSSVNFRGGAQYALGKRKFDSRLNMYPKRSKYLHIY